MTTILNRIRNLFRPSPKWEDMRDIPAATTGHIAHTGQPPAWKRNLHGLDAQARSERSRKGWEKRRKDG